MQPPRPRKQPGQAQESVDIWSAHVEVAADLLRGTDNAALLKAAAAIKPHFARTFTAFGQYN